jgi:hypothetical protein
MPATAGGSGALDIFQVRDVNRRGFDPHQALTGTGWADIDVLELDGLDGRSVGLVNGPQHTGILSDADMLR